MPPSLSAWRVRRYGVLASTSDLCRTLAEAGEPGGLAIFADRQSAGRGSRGRTWESPAGGLYLSVLLRPLEPARSVAHWALLAGVALAEALSRTLSERPDAGALALKWPNDVLLDGRKLGGVLLDCSAAAEGGVVDWLVIGMGVNLGAAPAIEGRASAGLGSDGAPQLGQAILERLTHWQRVRRRDGFAPVRAAWLAHGPAVGTAMTLRLADGLRGGTFAGLGEDGSLLLQTGGRVHSFATGEVLLAHTPA